MNRTLLGRCAGIMACLALASCSRQDGSRAPTQERVSSADQANWSALAKEAQALVNTSPSAVSYRTLDERARTVDDEHEFLRLLKSDGKWTPALLSVIESTITRAAESQHDSKAMADLTKEFCQRLAQNANRSDLPLLLWMYSCLDLKAINEFPTLTWVMQKGGDAPIARRLESELPSAPREVIALVMAYVLDERRWGDQEDRTIKRIVAASKDPVVIWMFVQQVMLAPDRGTGLAIAHEVAPFIAVADPSGRWMAAALKYWTSFDAGMAVSRRDLIEELDRQVRSAMARTTTGKNANPQPPGQPAPARDAATDQRFASIITLTNPGPACSFVASFFENWEARAYDKMLGQVAWKAGTSDVAAALSRTPIRWRKVVINNEEATGNANYVHLSLEVTDLASVMASYLFNHAPWSPVFSKVSKDRPFPVDPQKLHIDSYTTVTQVWRVVASDRAMRIEYSNQKSDDKCHDRILEYFILGGTRAYSPASEDPTQIKLHFARVKVLLAEPLELSDAELLEVTPKINEKAQFAKDTWTAVESLMSASEGSGRSRDSR